MPSKKPKSQRRSQEERRLEAETALFNAAKELFAEHGITSTSLAMIGERAGYSRGLVNHYFGSKDVLIEKLISLTQAQFAEKVRDFSAASSREKIENWAKSFIQSFFENDQHSSTPQAFFVMWGASFPNESSTNKHFRKADEMSRQYLVELLRQGQQNGDIAVELDPPATATALLGLVRGTAAQVLIAPDTVDRKTLVGECGKLIGRLLST